jgi:DNA-directed RNA polymerase specialized sigma24 family protein
MLLGHTASAADAVQQVFVALVGRGRGSANIDDEGRYLRRAVRNECFNSLCDYVEMRRLRLRIEAIAERANPRRRWRTGR